MTSLLATANAYGWTGKNLRAGLGVTRHPAGTNAPASGDLSLTTFAGQSSTIQPNSGVSLEFATTPTNPFSMTVDATGNIFVGMSNNVSKKTPDGTISTFATGFSIGILGIKVDTSGNVFVSDTYSNVIKKITSDGLSVTTFASGFLNPIGIDVDSSGNVFVANLGTNQIKKITSDGLSVTTFATGVSAPWGIVLLGDGTMMVADAGNHVVKKIDSSGATVATYTGFVYPQHICKDSFSNVYVADKNDNSIKKITDGVVTTIISSTGPVCVACDTRTNNLYISGDTANNPTKIYKIT